MTIFLELLRIVLILIILFALGWGIIGNFYALNTVNESHYWLGTIAILLLIFVLYRNKLQFSGWYKGKEVVKLPKNVTITLIISSLLFILLPLFTRGDDHEQIARVIHNNWNSVYIEHIEVIEDNKSVAFFHTADGEEREVYLEKSLFSWKNIRDLTFIREGITKPIHLSFSNSPYTNEEDIHLVLLRVFDKEIDRVEIVKEGETIHKYQLRSKDSEEKFGLFRTEIDDIYEAEFIAYNSAGAIVFNDQPLPVN
ncbi:hypothetical protein [Ureibacillus acetophenoni]|nr:hypothetical protein [Ureibacillus acetophenoni]